MTRMLSTLTVLLGLSALPSLAADPSKIAGDWEGLLAPVPAIEMRLVLRVTEKDGVLSATLDSPDEGFEAIPVEKVAKDGDSYVFTISKIKAEYKAKPKDDGLDGTWTQGGKPFPLPMTRSTSNAKADLWEGKIKLNAGLELRLALRLTKKSDGTFRATLDSPDQGVKALKVNEVSVDKTELSFKAKALNAEFSGKFNEAGTEVVGNFTQNGAAMPMTMKKVEKLAEVKRTQTPKPPFPYRSEEVSYPNKAGKNSLAGTLTLPEGAGPFPAVVLISGSGPQDRDEMLLGHRPFLVLADYLSRRGVAVLRYDDRGVGSSTGSHNTATSEDFATDANAGVEFLKQHKAIDAKKIGLMGHSEGGLIAPMVAAKSVDVAFIVLLAGPGVPGNEILAEQNRLIAKAMGGKDDDVAKSVANAKKMYEVIRTEKDDAEASKKIAALAKESLDSMTEAERKSLGVNPAKALEAQLAILKSPWFRFFLMFDPRPTLAKVKCPVFAINGEKDLQVPPGQSLPEIKKAVESGGNSRVTTLEMPGLNHLFQTCKTGTPAEYAAIEETISPAALKAIGDWIAEQVK